MKDRKIERDDFCRSVNIFITMEDLEEYAKNIGFTISKEEIYQVFKDFNAHKSGYLPMEDFYKKLTCWRDYGQQKEKELREIRD